MWIVLGILGSLAALVTIVMLLPVKLIIKNNAQNQFSLRLKFLFMTFDGDTSLENTNSNNSIAKAFLSATGIERLRTKQMQKNIQSDGLRETVSESFSILKDLLKELIALLKHCTITRLHIKIRASGEDVDDAAIHYGQCCAATYSLLNVLRSFLKIRKRGCNIDLGCNFFEKSLFHYEIVLSFRAFRVLGSLWRVALAETRRAKENAEQE